MTGVRRALYRRFPAIGLALRNLRRNRLRSALAVLGIVIGVLAIATLGILGNVLQLSAAQSLGGFGDQVIVSPSQETGVESLTARDVQRIERAAGDRAEVVPLLVGQAQVRGGSSTSFAQLYGTATPRVLFRATEGELPARHRQGALVGVELADSLDIGVGSTLDIEGSSYRVIAVLDEPEAGFSPIQPQSSVVLPPDVFRDQEVGQVVIQADSGRDAAVVADRVRERVNAREQRVSVFELREIVEQIDEFFGLLSAFLSGIGAISLVVAGVAILNIMLVTTVERREEIGVMRAVGIYRWQVLKLILAEAAMLGVLGSILGALLSAAVVFGLYLYVPQIELSVVLATSNGYYLLVAAGFGVIISLISGLYPAYRAANQRPVDALRG